MKRKLIFLSSTLCIFLVLLFCIMFQFYIQNDDLKKQEKLSEIQAEEYLIQVSKEELVETQPNSTETTESELNYIDDTTSNGDAESNYYGYIDCVLEIPKIKFRQSVYTGTVEQIQNALSNWFAVTARANYKLGHTRYCIYMHNTIRTEELSISKAQDTLKPNDYIVLTQKNKVYLYKVDRVFPEWKDMSPSNYVDNENIPRTKLYILTCGLRDWAGRNMVIESTIYDTYDISDWNTNRDQYINEYKKAVGIIKEPEILPELNMALTQRGKQLAVEISNKDYTKIEDCTVGIFDKDGMIIGNPIPYENTELLLPVLNEGEYLIGVYDAPDGYVAPTPYRVVIDQETTNINYIDESLKEEAKLEQQIMFIALCLVGSCVGICLLGIILTVIQNKKEKNT